MLVMVKHQESAQLTGLVDVVVLVGVDVDTGVDGTPLNITLGLGVLVGSSLLV
jgi:hypothetical protein